MTSKLVETTAPAAPALDLADVKLHLRVTQDIDDDLIAALISAATLVCEQYTGLALITRTLSYFIDRWPGASATGWWDGLREGADVQTALREITLPRPPLLSVLSVKTYDSDNNSTTYAASNYFVDAGLPGRLVLKNAAATPDPAREAAGIEISFTAGYGASASSIPAALKQGMKQVVAQLYENRGDNAESALHASGAEALFQPFRRMTTS